MFEIFPLPEFAQEYFQHTGIYGAIAIIVVVTAIIIFFAALSEKSRKKQIAKEIAELEANNMEMTVQHFFKIRANILGKSPDKEYAEKFDCTGMYILHNKNIDQYYVGQSENVLRRLNQHFTGSGGNADVYADYKNGDEWTIRIVPLCDSGFRRLNALEKYGIELYSAYTNGYNKTRGNK